MKDKAIFVYQGKEDCVTAPSRTEGSMERDIWGKLINTTLLQDSPLETTWKAPEMLGEVPFLCFSTAT